MIRSTKALGLQLEEGMVAVLKGHAKYQRSREQCNLSI